MNYKGNIPISGKNVASSSASCMMFTAVQSWTDPERSRRLMQPDFKPIGI
jgi:hypothetical protein